VNGHEPSTGLSAWAFRHRQGPDITAPSEVPLLHFPQVIVDGVSTQFLQTDLTARADQRGRRLHPGWPVHHTAALAGQVMQLWLLLSGWHGSRTFRTPLPPGGADARTGAGVAYPHLRRDGGYWTLAPRFAAYQLLEHRMAGARFLTVSVHFEPGSGQTSTSAARRRPSSRCPSSWPFRPRRTSPSSTSATSTLTRATWWTGRATLSAPRHRRR
jgi:hypothetical protein